MLTTNELMNSVMETINDKIPNADWSGFFFCECSPNSVDGIYIFEKKGKYYIMEQERGCIKEDVCSTEEKDIIYETVRLISIKIAMCYAKELYDGKKDFRRALFAKQIELISLLGDDYRQRIMKRINSILENNPFVDRK